MLLLARIVEYTAQGHVVYCYSNSIGFGLFCLSFQCCPTAWHWQIPNTSPFWYRPWLAAFTLQIRAAWSYIGSSCAACSLSWKIIDAYCTSTSWPSKLWTKPNASDKYCLFQAFSLNIQMRNLILLKILYFGRLSLSHENYLLPPPKSFLNWQAW